VLQTPNDQAALTQYDRKCAFYEGIASTQTGRTLDPSDVSLSHDSICGRFPKSWIFNHSLSRRLLRRQRASDVRDFRFSVPDNLSIVDIATKEWIGLMVIDSPTKRMNSCQIQKSNGLVCGTCRVCDATARADDPPRGARAGASTNWQAPSGLYLSLSRRANSFSFRNRWHMPKSESIVKPALSRCSSVARASAHRSRCK
jgi:hypothetical protein